MKSRVAALVLFHFAAFAGVKMILPASAMQDFAGLSFAEALGRSFVSL
jgi:hypothetical protein